MTKKAQTAIVWATICLIAFCPFPTRLTEPIKVQFVYGDPRPVERVRVYQDWESYGLQGKGRDGAETDDLGCVTFPARKAYGSIATRILGHAFSLLNVHASSPGGARVTVEFTLPPSLEIRFHPPAFSPVEPFATSGAYRDTHARLYFPWMSPEGKQVVKVTGRFAAGKNELLLPVEKKVPNKNLELAAPGDRGSP